MEYTPVGTDDIMSGRYIGSLPPAEWSDLNQQTDEASAGTAETLAESPEKPSESWSLDDRQNDENELENLDFLPSPEHSNLVEEADAAAEVGMNRYEPYHRKSPKRDAKKVSDDLQSDEIANFIATSKIGIHRGDQGLEPPYFTADEVKEQQRIHSKFWPWLRYTDFITSIANIEKFKDINNIDSPLENWVYNLRTTAEKDDGSTAAKVRYDIIQKALEKYNLEIRPPSKKIYHSAETGNKPGGTKRKNKKRTNKKRTNKKRTNKKRTNKKRTNKNKLINKRTKKI